ncbi:MAG: hypothetical protein ACYDEA_12390, partial [Candidatus Dormibacteria bacterium]
MPTTERVATGSQATVVERLGLAMTGCAAAGRSVRRDFTAAPGTPLGSMPSGTLLRESVAVWGSRRAAGRP